MTLQLENGKCKSGTLYEEAVQLLGHEGSVLTARYSPSGNHIASGGMDKDILLWNLPTDQNNEEPNYGVLQGHKGATTSLIWMLPETIFSGSSDTTVAFWDAELGTKKRAGKLHTGIVNACCAVDQFAVSVADDGCAIVWDEREKGEVLRFSTEYPLLACDASSDTIYISGIDSYVRAYDLKTKKVMWKSQPFQAPTTSLKLSHDKSMLAARSMDGDVRLLATTTILTEGVSRVGKYGYEGSVGGPQRNLITVAFSADDTLLALGSEEPLCQIWGTASRQSLHKLSDHSKGVLAVDFHPHKRILLTASADSTLVVREL